jgi:tetratricopeptide (TPR) repeat protein
LIHAGIIEQAVVLVQRSRIELRHFAEPLEIAQADAVTAVNLAMTGAFAAAEPFFKIALESLERSGDVLAVHEVRNDRAIAYTKAARFAEARSDFNECLTIANNLGDESLRIQTLHNRGEMERRAGEHDTARSLLQQAAELARKTCDRQSEAEALGTLGITLINMELWDEASDAFQTAKNLACSVCDKHIEALAVGGLASVRLHECNFKDAADLYRRAAELGQEVGEPDRSLENLAGLVESLAAAGELEAMEKVAQRMVDLAQQIDSIPLAVHALVAAAQRLAKLELFDDAAGTFAGAIVGAMVTSFEDQTDMLLAWPIYAMVDSFSHLPVDQAESLYNSVIDNIGEQQDVTAEDLKPLQDLIRYARTVHQEHIVATTDSLSSTDLDDNDECTSRD